MRVFTSMLVEQRVITRIPDKENLVAKTTEIAAADWLTVRERVSEKLRDGSPRSEKDTRTRMAESLILSGYIDVDFIRGEIQAERDERERQIAEREAARAQAAAEGDD